MSDSPYELRLSQAAMWARCFGCVRMNRTQQAEIIDIESDNTVRDEGTAMHWIAQILMTTGQLPVAQVAPNGVVITDELLDGAEFYADFLRQEHPGDLAWHIEETLGAMRIHAVCGGTPDAFGYHLSEKVLYVTDLKGGYRPVEVFPNMQLIGYVAAILDNYPSWETPDLMIEFVIVQPRAFHKSGPVRRQRVSIWDVHPHIVMLKEAASCTIDGDGKCVAGPQCDHCRARAACSTCHVAAMRALEISGDADVQDLSGMAIDYEMQRLEDAVRIMEARLTGLQAQASYMIRNGESLPNYALESGPSRLNWIDEATEQAALMTGDLLGVNLRKPARAITPTQALKKLPKELLQEYAQQKRGEVKLVRFDRNAAVKAFSHLKKEIEK